MARRIHFQELQHNEASPQYVGTIVGNASTPTTNITTATPFYTAGEMAGRTILICPDAACYILPGASVTATNGVPLAANERVTITLTDYESALAILSTLGTVNVKIFWLR